MYSCMWPLNGLIMASCHRQTKVLFLAVFFHCCSCAGFAAWPRHSDRGWKPGQQRDKPGRSCFSRCLTKSRWELEEGKGEQFTEESHRSTDLGTPGWCYFFLLFLLRPRHFCFLPDALSDASLTPCELTQLTNLTEITFFICLFNCLSCNCSSPCGLQQVVSLQSCFAFVTCVWLGGSCAARTLAADYFWTSEISCWCIGN